MLFGQSGGPSSAGSPGPDGNVRRPEPIYELAEGVVGDRIRAREAVRYARSRGWTHQHSDVGISTAAITSLGIDVALGIENPDGQHHEGNTIFFESLKFCIR